MGALSPALLLALALGGAGEAQAQRAQENAARSAGDAFGTNIGSEQVGVYSGADTRGFSPTTAGNVRLDGLYADAPFGFNPRLITGSQIRVGLTAQSYPFPAPTGIIDFGMRPVGDRPVHSLLTSVGPHGAYSVEFDAQGLIVPGRFGVAYGAYINKQEPQADDTLKSIGLAISPRWRPREGVEIRPFATHFVRWHDLAGPLTFAGGPVLPREPKAQNFTPDWTGNRTVFTHFGLVSSAALNKTWTLRGGVFHFIQDDDGPISDAYLNTDANGVAQIRRFANQRPFHYISDSGEARLSGVFVGENLRHTVHFSLRARDVRRNYGGGAVANFGPSLIGQHNAPAEPIWSYGAETDDHISQQQFSVSYALARRGLGEVGFGVQKVRYEKTLTPEFGPKSTSRESPLFWNGSASLSVSDKLALYGAFTRGLEEAPAAPEVAANAQEAPPAIHTKQVEVGLRYVLKPGLRLVVGYFDIQKPYFSLDGARFWRELGVERHRGIETSLSGEVLPGLNVVVGYVLQKPRVSGEAVRSGLIGPDPVGQLRRTGRVNLDYRPPWNTALSFEAGVIYTGGRAVSTRLYSELGGKQLHIKQSAGLDLGGRYRFKIRGAASTLRLQVQNISDTRRWLVSANGGMTLTPPRRFVATLTTDF